jgi:arylformamidase
MQSAQTDMLKTAFKIIDISQPVTSTSACFPGDVPFSRKITLTYEDSKVVNLSAMTLSPHVGTHADAPSHIEGSFDEHGAMIGAVPLGGYLGPAEVVDLAPLDAAIEPKHLNKLLERTTLPERLLFRTQNSIRYHVFEEEYAYFSVAAVDELGKRGVKLMGLDTPSVDHVRSKNLEAHHALQSHSIVWLENLDLTNVKPGRYFLIALPLKFMELEASPVRAVLLEGDF